MFFMVEIIIKFVKKGKRLEKLHTKNTKVRRTQRRGKRWLLFEGEA